MVAEFGEITRAEIGQFAMLPVTPDVLHRVELRRIARQTLDRELTILGSDEFAHQDGSMRGQPVPHHQQLAPQLAQQVAEKIHHLRGADRTLIETEVEVPPSDASRGREHFPIDNDIAAPESVRAAPRSSPDAGARSVRFHRYTITRPSRRAFF